MHDEPRVLVDRQRIDPHDLRQGWQRVDALIRALLKFRNGTLKRFKFPIRTTPEGQADPAAGYTFDGDINDEILFNEPDCIGTDLFTLGG